MRTGTLPLAVLRAGQGGWLGEGDGDPDSFKSRSRGQSPRGSSRDLGSPLAPVLTCARRWAQWCGAPALLWGDGGRNPRSAPSRLPCGAPSRWCPMGGAKPRSSLCWFSEPRGPWVPPGTDKRPLGKPFSMPPALSWGLVNTGLPSYPASLFLPRGPSLHAPLPTRRGEHGGCPGREQRCPRPDSRPQATVCVTSGACGRWQGWWGAEGRAPVCSSGQAPPGCLLRPASGREQLGVFLSPLSPAKGLWGCR